jgi:hypothetical protein
MCGPSCWYARSPPSACRCSCRGAHHGCYRGRGYSRYHASYRERDRLARARHIFIVSPRPKPQSIGDYFKSIGKSVLTNALLYALSAAIPPFGAVAIPAKAAYDYSKLSYGLYKVYGELSSKRKVSGDSLMQASGPLGEFVTQPAADDLASKITTKAQESGLFKEIADRTNIQEVVYAEMLRGSTSSALSTSGGELAKFVIRKAVGA